MFIQSHVPQHAELHLLFSMFTPLGWLERVPTYKDQQEQLREKDLNTYGFLGYPLLQAADILLYKPEFVPVGADQVAHVELTREVARKFNHLYSPQRLVPGGETGGGTAMKTEPDPTKLLLLEPHVLLTPSPKLPGLDGRKMSKSYGNAIYLTDPRDTVYRKALSMSNGGQRPTQADPGNPEICPVGDLHRIFSLPVIDQQIREGCTSATIRCDECKFKVATSIFAVLHPIQIRRRELEDKADIVWEVLENGSERARQAAEVTMKEVRAVTGLSRNLSGIHIHKSLPPAEQAADARNLSAFSDWAGLAPAVLTANLSQLWRRQILPPEVQLKPDAGDMWLTPNNRRVCVTAAFFDQDFQAWIFSVKPKSYEIFILLCWGADLRVHDFVIPQKLYLGLWVAARKSGGKSDVTLHVKLENGRYLLYISSLTPAIDITDTERGYGIF
jgi:tryptophanyl-tRNA synthetase